METRNATGDTFECLFHQTLDGRSCRRRIAPIRRNEANICDWETGRTVKHKQHIHIIRMWNRNFCLGLLIFVALVAVCFVFCLAFVQLCARPAIRWNEKARSLEIYERPAQHSHSVSRVPGDFSCVHQISVGHLAHTTAAWRHKTVCCAWRIFVQQLLHYIWIAGSGQNNKQSMKKSRRSNEN